MATSVAVFNPAALPAFAKKRGELSATAKALAGGGGNFGKAISIKGGVFRLIADGKEVSAIDERYLDVVVVAAAPKITRTWYAKKFTEDGNAGPACWSADGVAPDPTSANVQSDTCANCEKNVKGSGEGDMRACRYSQRVAVVLANDIEGDVMRISLPAQSIFGKEENGNMPLQAYARWLGAQNISPEEVVTRLRFDTSSENPKLFFKTMRWLENEEFEVVVEKGKSKDAVAAITMTVTAQTGAAAPAAKPAPRGPQPADEEVEPPHARQIKPRV